MAEGRGVSNYAVDKPSYAYTTSTTEFDDALISRGIVSFEQAMIGKGASPQEARRLAELHFGGKGADAVPSADMSSGGKDSLNDCNSHDESSDVDSNDSDLDDDGDFMAKYREMRISQLRDEAKAKNRRHPMYGDVISISRPDWKREVNDASQDDQWVVVNLLAMNIATPPMHHAACQAVDLATRTLASRYPSVKFVSIASTSAIENWPDKNLPTMFCYQNGKMRHQLVGVEDFGGYNVNCGRVEFRLGRLGVLDSELKEDPDCSTFDPLGFEESVYSSYSVPANKGSKFGGMMTQMATGGGDSNSETSD